MTSAPAQDRHNDHLGLTAMPDQLHTKLLSFEVCAETYAVDVTSVREIKGWTQVTSLPNQPAHVCGVLNLRGTVLPVVDLRRRLNKGRTEPTPRHVMLIVDVRGRSVGLLADAVCDILTASPDDIRPVPDTGTHPDAAVFSGFLSEDDRLIALLDLDQLLGADLVDSHTPNDAAPEPRATGGSNP